MKGEYPNLPLIEERLKNTEVFKKIAEENKVKYVPFEAYVFPQDWPDTAGGFSRPGFMSGQAITKQYTTVMISWELNIFGVFFGNKLGYIVDEPNDIFMKDFKNRHMKDVGEAILAY